MVWVHPQTASSTTGALVGAASLRPYNSGLTLECSKIDKQVRILKIVVLRLVALQSLLSKGC
jgi:hypothetical protein